MRIGYLILGIVSLVFLSASAMFYLQMSSAQNSLKQNNEMITRLRKEFDSISQEKENLLKEKEKLQENAVSYIDLKTKLEEEKTKLEEELASSKASIQEKQDELEKAKLRLERFEKRVGSEISKQKERLDVERAELAQRVKNLEANLKNEKATYNYNLGVAYAQAKDYEEALSYYKKALEINPNMADAHYNIGILYENYENDPESAIKHYKRFLDLGKDEVDKGEVREWITRLERKTGGMGFE